MSVTTLESDWVKMGFEYTKLLGSNVPTYKVVTKVIEGWKNITKLQVLDTENMFSGSR